MPRIYKGTTAKLALMYYPCVINPSDVSELTIAIYSEGTNEAIEYSLDNMTLKDNIAFINLAKYQLDVLDNGVIKYVARGVYKGNEFVQDRYSNYYIQTPKDYVIEDVAVQDIKRVDISELITSVLPDSGYDGMGEVIVDANPLINNVADNAVTLDVDKNGTYVAELADNYKGYIKEINVSVPSVNVEQLTQEEYDNITPAKDKLYLISDAIPEHNLKTINGETLVGEGDIVIESGTDIPYLVIDNLSILGGDFDAVYDAINNKQPYYIYKKRNSGELIDAECAAIRDNYIDVIFCVETYYDNELHFYFTSSEIYSDRVNCIKDEIIDIPTQFKTINGNDILGEGDITIESNVDLSDYYTKGETDNKYQPKGNYLTSIPEEYVTDSELTEKGYATEQWVEDKGYLKEIPEEYITETELNEALANIGGGIPYLWVTYNETDGYKYIGSFTDVIDAIVSQKPFIVYVPSGIHNYYTTLELVEYNQYMINGVGYTHTYDTNYFTQWMLYKDSTQNKRLNHINEYAEKSYVDEQLGNINNLLENIIG